MASSSICIEYREIDNDKLFVSISIGSKDFGLSFGILEFVNEMDFFNISTRFEVLDDKCGFVFDNDVDKQIIEGEIENFAHRYELLKEDKYIL